MDGMAFLVISIYSSNQIIETWMQVAITAVLLLWCTMGLTCHENLHSNKLRTYNSVAYKTVVIEKR